MSELVNSLYESRLVFFRKFIDIREDTTNYEGLIVENRFIDSNLIRTVRLRGRGTRFAKNAI